MNSPIPSASIHPPDPSPSNPSPAKSASTPHHSWRVLSQSVRVTAIDFSSRSFHVSTQLEVLAVVAGVRQLALDCGDACLLPNEAGYRACTEGSEENEGQGGHEREQVTVNGSPARYVHNRVRVFPDSNSLSSLQSAYQRAQLAHRGDLVIEIPQGCDEAMAEQRVLTIHIDVYVHQPVDGVHFVLAPTSSTTSSGSNSQHSHLYTYRSHPAESSTHHWLPCIDSADQLSLWRFEFVVDSGWTAVGCGDVVDTVPMLEKGKFEAKQQTFFYQLMIPTSPWNIGFAIGRFHQHADVDMPELVSYCLPGLEPLLRHTCSGNMPRAMGFYEELLSCRYPYGTYRQVFVDETPDDLTSYASISLLPLSTLYHRKVLDLVQSSRQMLAYGLASQFFGCFLSAAGSDSQWLVRGLARHLAQSLYVERHFGVSEALFQLQRTMNTVCDFERKHGKLVLAQKRVAAKGKDELHPSLSWLSTVHTHNYHEAVCKKALLVMGMLQRRLGRDAFLKVLQRLLTTAIQCATHHLMRPAEWPARMHLNLEALTKAVAGVTGKDLESFLEQWVYHGGHAHLHIQYHFNRRRNMVEVEVRQDPQPSQGRQLYVGPLALVIQELDGVFTHTIQVDAALSKHDLPCHLKGRKQKRKKIPLSTGEEEEINLSQVESDSPILWMRVDPEMLLLRQIELKQQAHQWELELRYERDVLSQLQAVQRLEHFPTHRSQKALEDVVENAHRFFFRIRQRAAFSLVRVCNRLPDVMIATTSASIGGQSTAVVTAHFPLIRIFQHLYGCKSALHIPQSNNYSATASHLQLYHLQSVLPLAIAGIRTSGGKVCPLEVIQFLVGLLRYNDNAVNRYSDDHYRASLITALGATLTRVDSLLIPSDINGWRPERLLAEARLVLTEVTHALNYDTMRPSFQRVVGIACLQVLLKLQQLGHLPPDEGIFAKFANCRQLYTPMRKVAMAAMTALLHRSREASHLAALMHLLQVVTDPSNETTNEPPSDLALRYSLADQLCLRPPFTYLGSHHAIDGGNSDWNSTSHQINPLNVVDVAETLWRAIRGSDGRGRRGTIRADARLRGMLVELFSSMYGRDVVPDALTEFPL